MADEQLFAILEDQRFLLRAYAASSARLMWQVFGRLRELQAFRGRKDLAPALVDKLVALRAPSDPVVAGAHLYALRLTQARREIARGVTHVLRGQGRKDPHLAGQLAGFAGAVLAVPDGRETAAPARKALRQADLDEILKLAEKEEGRP
jgi:hypothetical protein